MVENFRFGLARVDTPFFSILCDDDLLLPEFATASLAAFEKHPQAQFVATKVRRVYPDGRTMEPDGRWRNGLYLPPEGLFRLLENGVLIQTGVLFRREVLSEVGTYDPGADGAGDFDLQLRIAARFPFVVDPTPGGLYFSHDSSISGARKVSFVWPTYRAIIKNLESDARIPLGVRLPAKDLLVKLIKAKLVAIALGSALRGDVEQPGRAASILRNEMHSPVRAVLVEAMASVYGRASILRRITLWIVVRSRPFRISGWRRSQSIGSIQDLGSVAAGSSD
jgi:hypothetical protein